MGATRGTMRDFRKPVSWRALGSVLLLVLALAGCGRGDYYKYQRGTPDPDFVRNAPGPDAALGGAEPILREEGISSHSGNLLEVDPSAEVTVRLGEDAGDGLGGGGGAGGAAGGASADVTQDPRKPADKTSKADIYWKLVYLAQQGGNKPVPASLKRQIEASLPDAARSLIEEIVRLLETANEAYGLAADARSVGYSINLLPWSGASWDLDRGLADLSPRTGVSSMRAENIKDRIRNFGIMHHGSPESVRMRSIQEAQRRISDLRRMLDEERRRLGDHPISATGEDPFDSSGPDPAQDLKVPSWDLD